MAYFIIYHLESLSLKSLLDLDQRLLVDLLDGLLYGELVRDGGPEHGEGPVPDVLWEVRLHLLQLPIDPGVDGILIGPVVARSPGGRTSLRQKSIFINYAVGLKKFTSAIFWL